MPCVTIRDLSEQAHRALTIRAARNARTLEDEMRAILEEAALPAERVRLGTLLSALSRHHGITDADVEALKKARGTRPAEPTRFD